MIGASGVVAGLMGGVMRFLFNALEDQRAFRTLQTSPRDIPLMSLATALQDRRVQLTTVLWIVMNALMAVLPEAFTGGGPAQIAWQAHLGGYAAGFLAFGLFDVAPQHAAKTEIQP